MAEQQSSVDIPPGAPVRRDGLELRYGAISLLLGREPTLRSLLPSDLGHVAYEGSLTTPLHTEGVAWRVLVRPGTISGEQLDALRLVHDGNARRVQPMGQRRFL
ncbi:MAG: carbonic anhydrase family protein [Candidatus Limnocylindrales bacterium]